MLLSLLLACSPNSPVVTAVDPAEAPAGTSVKILGENFAEGVQVTLATDEQTIPLTNVDVKGLVLIEAEVPATTAAGVYDVRVTADGSVAMLEDGLTVVVPRADTPCSGEFTANTQLSLGREEVAIDRFYRGGDRETLRIPLDSIARVEYELVRREGGELCSVIWLRQEGGERVIFADDAAVDLKQRAYKMARDMGKQVEVTREDASTLEGGDGTTAGGE